MSDPATDPTVWLHGDWIQLTQTVGLWVTGGFGAWFVWRQNAILHRQNEIMSNQKDLNDLLIKQEEERKNARIKEWCKNAFKNGGNAGGVIQTTGSSLRRRFNDKIPLIVEAYEELQNEEPGLKFPPTHKFLETMAGIENGQWPPASEYWLAPRV